MAVLACITTVPRRAPPTPTFTVPNRADIEQEIDRLIALLDASDGDTDLEANGDELGDTPWIEWHNRRSGRADNSPEMVGKPWGFEDDEPDSDHEHWHVEPFAMVQAYGAAR